MITWVQDPVRPEILMADALRMQYYFIIIHAMHWPHESSSFAIIDQHAQRSSNFYDAFIYARRGKSARQIKIIPIIWVIPDLIVCPFI